MGARMSASTAAILGRRRSPPAPRRRPPALERWSLIASRDRLSWVARECLPRRSAPNALRWMPWMRQRLRFASTDASRACEHHSCAVDRSLVGRAAGALSSGRMDGVLPEARRTRFAESRSPDGALSRYHVLACRRGARRGGVWNCRRRVCEAAALAGYLTDRGASEAAVCLAPAAERGGSRRDLAHAERRVRPCAPGAHREPRYREPGSGRDTRILIGIVGRESFGLGDRAPLLVRPVRPTGCGGISVCEYGGCHVGLSRAMGMGRKICGASG